MFYWCRLLDMLDTEREPTLGISEAYSVGPPNEACGEGGGIRANKV